jgi:hypothetical protein
LLLLLLLVFLLAVGRISAKSAAVGLNPRLPPPPPLLAD